MFLLLRLCGHPVIKIKLLHILVFHKHETLHWADYAHLFKTSNENTWKPPFIVYFFSIRVFLSTTLTIRSTAGDHLYSYLPAHTLMNIQAFKSPMWDDYLVCLIVLHLIIRLLLDGIYPVWELAFDWMLTAI